MTPDELRALADAATPGPWAYEQIDRGAAQVGLVWDEDDKPISGVISPDDGTVIEHVAEVNRGEDARLIALAPSLARDHAALLDWAARAAEEMRQQADRDMSDFFTITFDWHDEHIGNGEEPSEDCVVCRLNALLAEWAEMQERPS